MFDGAREPSTEKKIKQVHLPPSGDSLQPIEVNGAGEAVPHARVNLLYKLGWKPQVCASIDYIRKYNINQRVPHQGNDKIRTLVGEGRRWQLKLHKQSGTWYFAQK